MCFLPHSVWQFAEKPLYLLSIGKRTIKTSGIMKQAIISIWRFYCDGFRQMTWGRVLWLIILLKLFVMFVVLRLFFFPDFLGEAAGGDKGGYVGNELIERAASSESLHYPY